MSRRSTMKRTLILVAVLTIHAACGKRADPLPPYVKTPQAPTALEVAQIGAEIEVRVTAPRTTTENRPLPIIQLDWLQGPPAGDFSRGAKVVLSEDVAPGEVRIKRFPLPTAEARFSVRARSGKTRSSLVTPVSIKPAPAPLPPSDVQAVNTTLGVELRWTNPQGAEPWPTPTQTPTPTSTPVPSPAPGGEPTSPALPSPSPSPSPSPGPEPGPSASPGLPPATPPGPAGLPPSPGQPPGPVTNASPKPSPTPSPTPTPTPVPMTGIRILRTDGVPRPAREPIRATEWLDQSVRPGDRACYSLSYYTSFTPRVESAPTSPVCVDVRDIVPPDPPDRLLGDIGPDFVELSWIASPSPDVASYRVYRILPDGRRSVALNTAGAILRVRDSDMTRGQRTYEVVAVDHAGNESAPSRELKILIP